MKLLFFILFLAFSYANPLRDFLFYFNAPTLTLLIGTFGNLFWGYFLAPWTGGKAMVQA